MSNDLRIPLPVEERPASGMRYWCRYGDDTVWHEYRPDWESTPKEQLEIEWWGDHEGEDE